MLPTSPLRQTTSLSISIRSVLTRLVYSYFSFRVARNAQRKALNRLSLGTNANHQMKELWNAIVQDDLVPLRLQSIGHTSSECVPNVNRKCQVPATMPTHAPAFGHYVDMQNATRTSKRDFRGTKTSDKPHMTARLNNTALLQVMSLFLQVLYSSSFKTEHRHF